MEAQKILVTGLICLAVIVAVPRLAYNQDPDNTRRLIVFYSPTCHKCSEIKNVVMPEIEKKLKDKVSIEYRDISDIQNYKLMLGLQEKYGSKIKNILPLFYLEGKFLNGEGEVKKNLKQFIEQALGVPIIKRQDLITVDLVERFKNFRPFAIISAGLIDGINPCAFTVIVFFISFLALQGYRKRQLIVIGLSFIFAVFLTYLLIGLGVFSFLYQLKGFWVLARLFNFSVGVLSVILGIFCLYDIFKFAKTGKTEGLVLQLPRAVKNQIHKVIGLHYRLDKSEQVQGQVLKKHIFKLFLSALITGFLVSILEAICTGQMYLPTIAFILKTTHLKLEALGYLVLYNLMFVAPLFIIFLFALWGVSSEQFARILKKHLVTVKIFMAILFFGLGIFLLYTQNSTAVKSTKEQDAVENQGPNSWDFGRVKPGEVLKHNFVIKNESKETLNIEDINTSCGCTTSRVKKKTLLPGEETDMEVKFNTKGYSGPTQQFVYVHTDNLDKPVIRYIIKADIETK